MKRVVWLNDVTCDNLPLHATILLQIVEEMEEDAVLVMHSHPTSAPRPVCSSFCSWLLLHCLRCLYLGGQQAGLTNVADGRAWRCLSTLTIPDTALGLHCHTLYAPTPGYHT